MTTKTFLVWDELNNLIETLDLPVQELREADDRLDAEVGCEDLDKRVVEEDTTEAGTEFLRFEFGRCWSSLIWHNPDADQALVDAEAKLTELGYR